MGAVLLASYALVAGLLLASSCNAAEFKSIPYKNCKSNFEILNVEATECEGKQKICPFRRGTTPTIRITFKPTRDVDSMETLVRAKVGAAIVPFMLEDNNACRHSNITCPLKAGKTYYYTESVKILDVYPKVNVQVNWLVNDKSNDEKADDENKRELCIFFLAKVV